MSPTVVASGVTLRALAIAALAGAVLGMPLMALGTHAMGGGTARDVVLALGFVLAVGAVVLAVLGLILSTRAVVFVAALFVTAGWIVLVILAIAAP